MSSGSRVPGDSSAAHTGSADGTDSGTTGTIGSGSETGAPVVEPFRESESVGKTAATEIEAGDELERGFATNERADEAETAAEAAMMAPTTGEVLAIVSASLAAAAAIVGVILLTLLWRQRKLDTAQAAGDHERYVLAR